MVRPSYGARIEWQRDAEQTRVGTHFSSITPCNIIRQKVTPNVRFHRQVRDFGHAEHDFDGGVNRNKLRDDDAAYA